MKKYYTTEKNGHQLKCIISGY